MSLPSAQLRILGHTELTCSGTRTGSHVLRQPKRLALLAYLALATTSGYRRRDQIVALFWPELDQAHARTQLRKALHALRATLGADAFSARGEEELRLDPAHVWCDAVAFRECLESARWNEALSLYRGDLLEGLFPGGVGEEFQTWLEEQRRALRCEAARAAWACSGQEELAGHPAQAMALARRAADLDRDDEEGIRRLIAMLDRHGDRAGALRVFQAWQVRLREEFDAEPAPETRRVVHRVQAERKGESMETSQSARLSEREMEPAGGASAQSDEAPLARPRYRSVPGSRRAAATWRSPLGVAALAITAIGAFIAGRVVPRSFEPASATAASDATIAVLPLRGVGGPVHSRLGEGIAEELTSRLARVPGVAVRSSARSRGVMREEGDLMAIARTLRVRYVVDGSVRGDERHARVVISLVRVLDGVAVWAAAFDADPSDALAAQQRIAHAALRELEPRLANEDAGKR